MVALADRSTSLLTNRQHPPYDDPSLPKTHIGVRDQNRPDRFGLVSTLVAGPQGGIGLDSPELADDPTIAMHYRARTYFPEIGRFGQPDPAERKDRCYKYVTNRPDRALDPSGLMLVAVDGSASKEWLKLNAKTGKYNSHVKNFFDDYVTSAGEQKEYWHGPALMGGDTDNIAREVLEWIVQRLCEVRADPIRMIGFSRGGEVVLWVAAELQKSDRLWCVEGRRDIVGPFRVDFMGLYDAVDHAGLDVEKVPSNVDRAVHAVSDPSVKSRSSFDRVGEFPEDVNKMVLWEREYFDATHGGVGGNPWGGDHPSGMTKIRDEAGSKAVDEYVRNSARAAGIKFAGEFQSNDWKWAPESQWPNR